MDIHKTARCLMNRTKKLIMTLVAAVVVGLGASAQAQETPPPASPPPEPQHHSAIIGGGSGAGIGVGAAVILSDTQVLGVGAFPGAQFVYDMAVLHFEGLFGFTSGENGAGDRVTNLVFGAGGWYHLHRGSESDFSLGALIAINTNSGPGPSTTITAFEPGATVRGFLTP